jgi:hypothetical protein
MDTIGDNWRLPERLRENLPAVLHALQMQHARGGTARYDRLYDVCLYLFTVPERTLHRPGERPEEFVLGRRDTLPAAVLFQKPVQGETPAALAKTRARFLASGRDVVVAVADADWLQLVLAAIRLFDHVVEDDVVRQRVINQFAVSEINERRSNTFFGPARNLRWFAEDTVTWGRRGRLWSVACHVPHGDGTWQQLAHAAADDPRLRQEMEAAVAAPEKWRWPAALRPLVSVLLRYAGASVLSGGGGVAIEVGDTVVRIPAHHALYVMLLARHTDIGRLVVAVAARRFGIPEIPAVLQPRKTLLRPRPPQGEEQQRVAPPDGLGEAVQAAATALACDHVASLNVLPQLMAVLTRAWRLAAERPTADTPRQWCSVLH